MSRRLCGMSPVCSALQRVPDLSSQRRKRQMLREQGVQNPFVAAQHSLVGLERFKNGKCLVAPQKMGNVERRYVRIHRRSAFRLDMNGTARTDVRHLDSPPRWQQLCRFCVVPFAHDQCRLVECARIGVDLQRKAVEGVGVAFEFVSMDYAVNYGYVDSAGTMLKSQFFHDERVRIGERFREHFFHDGTANVAIACGDTGRWIAV